MVQSKSNAEELIKKGSKIEMNVGVQWKKLDFSVSIFFKCFYVILLFAVFFENFEISNWEFSIISTIFIKSNKLFDKMFWWKNAWVIGKKKEHLYKCTINKTLLLCFRHPLNLVFSCWLPKCCLLVLTVHYLNP